MSKTQWSDRIPQIVEVNENGKAVNRWMVNGKVRSEWVCNCPAAMEGGVERGYYPQRWEEVPKIVYDPVERLKALDDDGVDGEVLFPNGPVTNCALSSGRRGVRACVRAGLQRRARGMARGERSLRAACIIPYLSGIEVVVEEVERAVKRGHRGVVMLAEPSVPKRAQAVQRHVVGPAVGLLPGARRADPLARRGSVQQLSLPHWKGFTQKVHSFGLAALRDTGAVHPQSHLLGRARSLPAPAFRVRRDRHRLGELHARNVRSRVGAPPPVDRRRRDAAERVFQRQLYVDFWYERAGIELRHQIGMNNIMWESDFPHSRRPIRVAEYRRGFARRRAAK